MRSKTLLVFLTLYTGVSFGQSNEFKLYSNGLIYSEQTMNRLSRVADSLNLRYKNCNFNTVFYSKSQAVGHLLTLEKGNIREAQKDIENRISWDDFIKKYPRCSIQKNVLIIRYLYKNYNDENVVEFEHFDLKNNDGVSIRSNDVSTYQREFRQEWCFEYFGKTAYSKESITAFYFPTGFSSSPLPQKYAQMIGYADCLIDTSTTKLSSEKQFEWDELPGNWHMLGEIEKANLLEKMRSTRVVGSCSQDTRPRIHAINIALLSAEINKWEVFLKAHLDIMNDRFDRVTDGSYAWADRNTYIKEIEKLNINVPDLILGISFRMENPATNHYYGSIVRLGRALAETNSRNEVETAMLAIISDDNLDLYNRLLFYFLFRNYNYYLKDEEVQKLNKEKLNRVVTTLPSFMSERLLSLK